MKQLVDVIDRDLGFNRILKDIKSLKGTEIKAGLFGDGDKVRNNPALLGLFHEYGTVKMPSRSFIRTAFDYSLKDLKALLNSQYWLLLSGRIRVKVLLNNVGKWTAKKQKDMILEQRFIALKPATLRRKKKTTILIESGKMFNSIQFMTGKQ